MSYSTKQKEIIAAKIAEEPGDFTIKSLCDALEGQDISRATIYRAIEQLETAGVLKKLVGSDGNVRYQYLDDCAERGHCYLKCKKCGRLDHVDCDDLSELEEHIMREHKFKVDEGDLIINGICEVCS